MLYFTSWLPKTNSLGTLRHLITPIGYNSRSIIYFYIIMYLPNTLLPSGRFYNILSILNLSTYHFYITHRTIYLHKNCQVFCDAII